MLRIPRPRLLVLALCLIGCCVPGIGRAAPAPEQALYWWQDELRTVCAALAKARTGQVAEWPNLTVPAGTLTLPLPDATGPIRADGKLDEQAWQQATRFCVGPIFDAWPQGPLMLEVRACRDAKQLYLAIESPRDLTGLGALSAQGELFTVNGTPYHVGPKGGLPAGAVRAAGAGQIIELALPITGPVNLTFAVEALRRTDGRLPPEAASLGLPGLANGGGDERRSQYRHPTLWLRPVSVRLLGAHAAARIAWGLSQFSFHENGTVPLPKAESVLRPTLTCRIDQPGAKPIEDVLKLSAADESGVYAYAWKGALGKQAFAVEGFLYSASPAAELAVGRAIARRSAELGSARAGEGPAEQEFAALEAEIAMGGPAEHAAWRDLYCRARQLRARAHLSMLDAPLLFVKQHPYFSGHIYDDFYPWHPGGGIYVLSDPHRFGPGRTVRPVIDPTTNETLGTSVYRDPALGWDARQIVFAAKTEATGVTSLYAIGLDGKGLHRLTSSDQHSDYQPAWLPDDRIVFISTRPRALVPCFNSGVGTLHTMHRDGSGIQSISVNNVNEFNPAMMPDGRILYGRWEYVDKTALYMQSLWTATPDGRMEEALFANNLARPTALLDARPVPGTHLVVASLTPHNGQPVGAIATIDPRRGKNNLDAVTNFTPEYPIRMDQGLRVGCCDPHPLSADDLLMADNGIAAHGVIELADRFGHRELVLCDPQISCYAPTLVKPCARPPMLPAQVTPNQPGRFLVSDVYQGLEGVPRGTVKRLRVVEETARTSGLPPGGRWWNQAFLVSWQGSYIVKNVLGVVPVRDDGSAYFEAPPGRALYFEALDAQGREVQRMRTFVQAAPGVTRSCIGCHEHKLSAPLGTEHPATAMFAAPAKIEPESWGSGFINYPTMIQPIFDKHCVRCHGGEQGLAHGLDFTGGWTWAFNLSYETLIKNRLVGFLNCNNASVHTSQLLRPRSIGSGAAHLADVLLKHPEVSQAERELMFAWMDTNSNYYGSWDYTPHATCDAILGLKSPLSAEMRKAGCTECHAAGHIGSDWVNLQKPEWSRILRAPLAAPKDAKGLPMCRERKAHAGYPLVDLRVQPPDVLLPGLQGAWDPSGAPKVSFASTSDPHYRAMLTAIRRARSEALTRPRVDMPGAEVVAGECRMLVPPPLPKAPPALSARLAADGGVELSWRRTADTVGLQYEIHRGPAAQFAPGAATRLGLTMAGAFFDADAPSGAEYYALVVVSGQQRGRPVWTSIDVPPLPLPAAPEQLAARPLPGGVELEWDSATEMPVRYDVYRKPAAAGEFQKITPEPLRTLGLVDMRVEPGTAYAYQLVALDRRGRQGPPSATITVTPLAATKEPVFTASFATSADAALLDGSALGGELHGGAKVAGGALEVAPQGFVTFDHRSDFDLTQPISVQCWLLLERPSPMPVVLSCGAFNAKGWFLQQFGHGWRWHLGGVSCDGGRPQIGSWIHLAATFDGKKAVLYQDGKQVGAVLCDPNPAPWSGPLIVGQYAHQAPQYQVLGRVAGVKIYQRALRAEEVAAAFQAGHK